MFSLGAVKEITGCYRRREDIYQKEYCENPRERFKGGKKSADFKLVIAVLCSIQHFEYLIVWSFEIDGFDQKFSVDFQCWVLFWYHQGLLRRNSLWVVWQEDF